MPPEGSVGFRDRAEAGRQLALALLDERSESTVAVGLARGGVVVAAEVARALGIPLDALAVRKVRHPHQPEYAIGAVTPRDGVYVRATNGLTDHQVQAAVRTAQIEAAALDRILHATRPAVAIGGKTCLLIDDGLATGATMIASLTWARAAGAERVIVCVPVGAADTVSALEQSADAVVVLEVPDQFLAVGVWYRDFAPGIGRGGRLTARARAEHLLSTVPAAAYAAEISCGADGSR